MDERNQENRTASKQEIEDVLAMLEGFGKSDVSRLKINVAEGEEGSVKKQYHHGRCDVGSPWACGTPFDVLE